MKPCIECGKDCEILPVQLGDLFTLTYLRVCSAECMFLIAYEYLRENCLHKSFRGTLYDRQDEEDKKQRDQFVKEVTDESLRSMAEHFKENPLLLSHPVPNEIVEMFKSKPTIPSNSGQTVTFSRPSKKDRVKWANEHVARLKKDLREALHDLEKLENESSFA